MTTLLLVVATLIGAGITASLLTTDVIVWLNARVVGTCGGLLGAHGHIFIGMAADSTDTPHLNLCRARSRMTRMTGHRVDTFARGMASRHRLSATPDSKPSAKNAMTTSCHPRCTLLGGARRLSQ